MKKLAFLLLFPALAIGQVQIQGKPGGAIQIGGNQPGVSSIQTITGDFVYTGSGFAGCSQDPITHITTCTFTGGTSTTVNTTLAGQCFVGGSGLVGAFTDGSGHVVQPICIGAGPVTFVTPNGATQVQLGVDTGKQVDNLGSFLIAVSVNGSAATNVTVPGTTDVWDTSINPTYDYGHNDGTAPIVAASGLSVGNTVEFTYISGTVSNGGPNYYDANGSPNPTQANPVCDSGTYCPTKYMGLASVNNVVTSINGTPGAFTFSGSGVSCSGTTCTFSGGGGGTPGGVPGNLQYNNAGAFGGDASTTDDGAGNISMTSLTTTGSAHGITIPAGTAVSGAANKVVIASDSTNGYLMANENNTGAARVCTATNGQCSAAGGSVSVNGSSVSSPNFNGTTPAAGTNGKNVTYQVSGSNVSSEIVGDGNAAHYLDGTGNYSTPAGAGTVTDSSGTTTTPQVALATTTLHQIQYSSALPNGITATTQSAHDNSTKVATTAYVDSAAGAGGPYLPTAGGNVLDVIGAQAGVFASGATVNSFIRQSSQAISGIGSGQGIANDGTNYYVSYTGSPVGLSKFNSSWTLQTSNTSIFTGITNSPNHVGDIEVYGGSIYAPLDVFTGCPNTSGHADIGVYATSTGLALSSFHDISASVGTSGASALAVDGVNGKIYVGLYCDGTRLLVYDLSTFALTSTLTLSQTVSFIQGLSYNPTNHLLYAMAESAIAPGVNGTIYAINPSTGMVTPVHATITNTEVEGVDYTQSKLMYVDVAGGEFTMLPVNVGQTIAVPNSIAEVFTLPASNATLSRVRGYTIFDSTNGYGITQNMWYDTTASGWRYDDSTVTAYFTTAGGTFYRCASGLSQPFALSSCTNIPSITNSTATVAAGSFSANTCTLQTAITMTGITTSSVLSASPSTDISAVVGWGSAGGLNIIAWPTANTFNWKVCNPTSSSITTGSSVTFNIGAR